jgi:hypothetical protein
MFALNKHKPYFDDNLVQYIKETTNKSIARYMDKHKKEKLTNLIVHTSAANDDNDCPNTNTLLVLLPFVSLFSFLAGYYSKRIFE